jgi:hypothetical protein
VDQSYQQFMAFTQQKILFQTGAGISYLQPLVIRFWSLSVTVVDAALAGVVVWIAYNVALGLYEPLRMLSRVVLAAIAAHASLTFAGLFIELNNAMCRAALQTATTPQGLDIAALLGVPVLGGRGLGAFLLQDLLIKILSDAVMFEMVVRAGVLALILSLLPFIALLLILPETQPAAQVGFSAFFVVTFLQFLQVSAIALGAALVTSLGATLSITSTLAGVAVLFFVLRIPGWLGSGITSYIGSIRTPWSSL